MKLRRALWLLLSFIGVLLIGFAAWLFSLPPTSEFRGLSPIGSTENDEVVRALHPPKRERPVIAIIGLNRATETTDYLMPYGILRRADIADVFLLSVQGGAVQLYPALKVESEASIAQFDARYPNGADYVIVPAMEPRDDPDVLAWIRKQAYSGAKIIGVCAGATVVAASGLLEGKRAVTHWFYLDDLLKIDPSVSPVGDRRYVVDHNVATTTGISASMPMSLTLIEAIAGRDKATQVAQELGLGFWDARHETDAFKITRPFATTVMANRFAAWDHENWGMELRSGQDEVALALVADAWSRTYRSTVATFSEGGRPVISRNGVHIIPDQPAAPVAAARFPELSLAERPPALLLNDTLEAISRRYGARTAEVVAMQLEYPWRPGPVKRTGH
jgi:Transcriptional regulator containing an amidase domain and an AraC-type DNA-binding HTH domain